MTNSIKTFNSNNTTRKLIIARGTYGMWMCSTNRDDNYEDYQTLLDTLSTHNSGWFLNPNSGNQIKLWYGIINQ